MKKSVRGAARMEEFERRLADDVEARVKRQATTNDPSSSSTQGITDASGSSVSGSNSKDS